MNPIPVSNDPEFDRYAEAYDSALSRGISVSGEDKHYFAEGRVRWLGRCLRAVRLEPGAVLDFGCGTGSATPYLMGMGAKQVTGVDLSERSLEVARRENTGDRARFVALSNYEPAGDMDLVFCNGVFHHIPLEQRAGALDTIYRSLRPGGYFALWENNPWNPGTRWVMRRIPFDRDAILVWPGEARRLAGRAGLEVVRTDYLFVFPRMLKWLRGFERALSGMPLGAQYQVLARRNR